MTEASFARPFGTATEEILAADYCRVSTDEQARDGTSLDTQGQRNKAFITAKGWKHVGSYVDDGVSGTKDRRPALDRLMEDCRAGRVNVIVFSKFDRFSRNRRHLENATAELDDLGVALVSVSENIDGSTASGQAFRALLGVFANLERDMIVERTNSGKRAIATAGFWPGGPPPYGFAFEKDGNRSHLIFDERELEMLRLAIDLTLDEGATTTEVAARLNALGYKPRKSARWSHANIRRVLLEASLSGEWTWSRPGRRGNKQQPISISIPAIITPARHQTLLRVLKSPNRPRVKNKFYLLSKGRLKAPCGDTFYGAFRHDRNFGQYRCYSSVPDKTRRISSPVRCGCLRINAAHAEDTVWTAICDLLAQPEQLTGMAEDFLAQQTTQVQDVKNQAATIDRNVAKLEAALSSAYVDRYQSGRDSSAMEKAIASMEAELDALRKHQEQLAVWRTANTAESERIKRIGELSRIAHDSLREMTDHDRDVILNLLKISVTVTGWQLCGACNATGRQRAPHKLGGYTCEVCGGARQVANYRIEGVLLDDFVEILEARGIVGEVSNGEPK